jgi:hypothetical protein
MRHSVVVESMALLLAVCGNIAKRSMSLDPPFSLQLHRTTIGEVGDDARHVLHGKRM